jgi:hypothetical protein
VARVAPDGPDVCAPPAAGGPEVEGGNGAAIVGGALQVEGEFAGTEVRPGHVKASTHDACRRYWALGTLVSDAGPTFTKTLPSNVLIQLIRPPLPADCARASGCSSGFSKTASTNPVPTGSTSMTTVAPAQTSMTHQSWSVGETASVSAGEIEPIQVAASAAARSARASSRPSGCAV